MGEAYRGLTIQFKADGTRVLSTLKSMTRAANQVESELRMVKKGLRFDGSSTKLAQAQLKLLAEKASAVGAEVIGLRRHMQELGKVEFGGVQMKELSARTKDASTQASLMQTRYNRVTSELAQLHKKMTETWATSKALSNVPNPFKEGWSKLSTEKLQGFISYMEKAGAISQVEAEKAKSALASLRPEFTKTEAELKKLNSIAEYQSMGLKIEQDAARAKAAIKEMVAAAKTLRGTGFEGRLEASRASIERLKASAKELNAAMKLNPRSFSLVAMHADALKGKITAIKAENVALREEMAHLGRTAGVKELAADMSLLSSSMSKNQAELERTAADLVNLKAKATEASERIEKMKNDLRAAGKADQIDVDEDIAKANGELKEHRAEIQRVEAEWKQASAAAEKYAKAVKYGENATKAAANEAMISAMQQNQTKKFKALSSSAATALGMTMYSSLYPAVMMAGTYAVQAAEEVDAAYRNMRKTVQGTDQEFESLKKSALEFGDTHYTAADQLLQIEAIGGQLGITVDNLEAFSKTIANLNIATNVDDPEVLATQFGKMASVMGLTSAEYDRFADSLVRLGNSEPAMESDILNMTTRFMGMGKVVGMSSDQMLAWATAAVSTGQKAEAAGSSMLRMTGRFEAAVAGVESMAGLEDLSEEDLEAFETAKDKLQGYADVAGMTAEQFANLWKADPSRALQSFVEGLHEMDKNGGSAVQALKDLGINNVRDQQLFLGLANTTDVLSDSLTMSRNAWNGVSDEWGDAGDASREAEKKMQGFSGALQIMKNNGQHLASMMGESLAPTLKTVTGVIQQAVGAFSELDPNMQQAITLAILGSAALGPLLTGYGAMSNAVKSAKNSWKEYTSAGNKVSRMESSRIMTMTGMSDRYKRWAADVDKAKASIERCNEAAKKPTVMTNPKAMAQVNEGWRTANANLTKAQLKMSALSKVQAFGGFLGSIGSMAAISAAVVGLEQLGTYLYDVHQKSEAYRQSTEGMKAAADNIVITSKQAGTEISLLSASMEKASYQHGMYYQKVQEVIKANAELATTVQERVNKAFGDSASAEFYAGKIEDLAGTCNGSAEKLAELQAYIDEYNRLTGGNVQVVNDFTGAVNLSTEALNAQKDAFIQNAIAEGYHDALRETAASIANTEVQIAKMDQSLQTVYDDAGKLGYTKDEFLLLAAGAEQCVDEFGNLDTNQLAQYYSQLGPEVAALIDKNHELLQSREELERQLAGQQELQNAAANAYEQQIQKATAASEAAKKVQEAEGSIKSFNEALLNNSLQDDTTFEEMAAQIGYVDEGVKELGQNLTSMGVNADQLGKIGTTAFLDLWNRAQEAGAGIEEVSKAVNLVNATGIDPKNVIIEDGQIKVATQELENFNAKELTSKGYTVDDQGTVTVETGKVDQLANDINTLSGTTATPTVKVDDQASAVIDDIMNKVLNASALAATMSLKSDTSGATSDLNNLDRTAQAATKDRSIGVSVKSAAAESALAGLDRIRIQPKYIDVYVRQHGSVPSGGQAAGGINNTLMYRVPAFASGGALNGIVTRPMMTNQGLVGEAGAEAMLRMGRQTAVVPLSNRRYVRPFARAVASEMGGVTQQPQQNVMNIYLDGRYLAGGVNENTTLGDLAKGLRRKARC